MKINDVKAMSTDELKSKLYSLQEEMFNLRRKKAVGQLEHGEQVRNVRKDIARINTVIREREIANKKDNKDSKVVSKKPVKKVEEKKVEDKKEAK